MSAERASKSFHQNRTVASRNWLGFRAFHVDPSELVEAKTVEKVVLRKDFASAIFDSLVEFSFCFEPLFAFS